MPATATTSLERLLDGLLKLTGTMAAHSRARGAEAGGLSRGDLSVLGTLAAQGLVPALDSDSQKEAHA